MIEDVVCGDAGREEGAQVCGNQNEVEGDGRSLSAAVTSCAVWGGQRAEGPGSGGDCLRVF